MEPKAPRDRAMALIATYDTSDAGKYEREVVRLARRWLRIMRSRQTTQGVVNKLLEQLEEPPEDCGIGWDVLRGYVIEWALAEEWLDDADPARQK